MWPSAGTPEALHQLLLRTRNAASLAANFREAGIVPVIDEVVATQEQLAAIEEAIPFASLTAVMLVTTEAVILERDAARSKHTAGNYLGVQRLVAEMVMDHAVVVDTTALTAAESVHTVVGLLPLARDGERGQP